MISSVVTSSSNTYQTPFTTKMLDLDREIDGQVVLRALKKLGNVLHTAGSRIELIMRVLMKQV